MPTSSVGASESLNGHPYKTFTGLYLEAHFGFVSKGKKAFVEELLSSSQLVLVRDHCSQNLRKAWVGAGAGGLVTKDSCGSLQHIL